MYERKIWFVLKKGDFLVAMKEFEWYNLIFDDKDQSVKTKLIKVKEFVYTYYEGFSILLSLRNEKTYL